MFFFKLNKQAKSKSSKVILDDMYGFWKIIKEVEPKIYTGIKTKKYRMFECLCLGCDKNNVKIVSLSSLRSKESTSCGCEKRRKTSESRKVHGFRYHPVRSVHRHMIDRCYNPKDKDYRYYGGRGVTICKEWRHDLGAFATWALANGYEKNVTQIDRKNNNGNYEPDNCHFVTRSMQMNNTRNNVIVKFKGQKFTFINFWRKYNKGISYPTALIRYKNQGMSAIQSVTMPLKRKPR